ncbi:hypothetical protein PR048_010332 [Dryococelus australis]|uniref:Uncharacterized protein n=1 Tax=Dryococelus australis TaxID=614101 RepID=A0ABQ9I2F6_9NEOP|nr:hypothetical protein PR048_010332 [Dryococelus australis]
MAASIKRHRWSWFVHPRYPISGNRDGVTITAFERTSLPAHLGGARLRARLNTRRTMTRKSVVKSYPRATLRSGKPRSSVNVETCVHSLRDCVVCGVSEIPKVLATCTSVPVMSQAENKRVRSIASAAVCVAAINIAGSGNKTKRRAWVEYRRHNHMPLIEELRENYPDDYKNDLRMDSVSFDSLLDLIKNKISKTNTMMRKCISAEERLTATLRFLAIGRSFEDLKFTTGTSASSLCAVIPETCKAMTS